MDPNTVVLVAASEVLSYTAAFFFVLVAIALAYALVRVGKMMGHADKVLDDIDRQAVLLLRKSGETLDGVNGSLANVDEITRDVADMTDKVNGLVAAVDSALQTPAKKAAAFGSGVQQAVSSFLRRDQRASAGAAAETAGAAAAWETAAPAWETPPAATGPEVAATESEAAAEAAGTGAESAEVASEAAEESADVTAESAGPASDGEEATFS